MVSSDTNPITVLSGNEVSIKAQKDTSNYIYDTRSAVAENDTASYSGAIHSEVDLEIGGKGNLFVVSSNNNGIHSKNDLQVQMTAYNLILPILRLLPRRVMQSRPQRVISPLRVISAVRSPLQVADICSMQQARV